jgi:hypothetical protein
MTFLEKLIEQRVAASTVESISRAADTVGEQIAQELLRDPDFRDRLRVLARLAVDHTMVDLTRPAASDTIEDRVTRLERAVLNGGSK